MKNDALKWCTLIGYALVLLLAILCVIATAAMPRWYLITVVVIAGLGVVDWFIIRWLKKHA